MGYHVFSVQKAVAVSLYLLIIQVLYVNRIHLDPHLISLALCLFVSAGKKNKLRLYYLSWLRNKILHNDPEVEKRQGWTSVGDLEGCVHYKVGKCAPVRTRWWSEKIQLK